MISISELSLNNWIWYMLCAMLIGIAKAGVKGVGMLAVPILAVIFGGKLSAGLLLPILSMADIFAVSYYNKHASWKHVWRILPAALFGVLVAVAVGYYLSDAWFKNLIGIFVIGSIIIMVIQERSGLPESLTESLIFGSIFGFLGGFTTMIGNAAGPILTVYLLAMHLPKNSFIGTGAWFFLIINLFKIPFHVFVWKTITWSSFSLNLLALPAIAIGVFIGIKIIKLLPEKAFRYFVIVMTFLAAIRLFF